MAVRNFWISAQIDGRSTPLSGGPRAKDGGFELTIYQRENGGIIIAANIAGWVRNDGELFLRCTMETGMSGGKGRQDMEFTTRR